MNPEIKSDNLERDFFNAYNANNRRSIEIAISQVAHYRGLTTEEVKIRLIHIIENLKAGSNLI